MSRYPITDAPAAQYHDEGCVLIRAMLDAGGIDMLARAARECFATTTRPCI
jgi:hypothetical protein